MRVLTSLLLTLAPVGAEAVLLTRWDKLTPAPALMLEGQPALHWPEPATQVTVNALGTPTDWSRFKCLRFAMHSARAVPTTLTLVMESQNPASEGIDYFTYTFKADYQGWREHVLPLAMVGKARQPLGWDKIGKVYLSSNWAHVPIDPGTELHFGPFVLDTE
ncbi:MAG: hypothetical protein HUU35_14370, partial [Armatimonadetes bacterium]|nr:hypothetical protein [Armatimonadota bacterium]